MHYRAAEALAGRKAPSCLAVVPGRLEPETDRPGLGRYRRSGQPLAGPWPADRQHRAPRPAPSWPATPPLARTGGPSAGTAPPGGGRLWLSGRTLDPKAHPRSDPARVWHYVPPRPHQPSPAALAVESAE